VEIKAFNQYGVSLVGFCTLPITQNELSYPNVYPTIKSLRHLSTIKLARYFF